MVEHQGAMGLRGGLCISTQYRKAICSDTFVQAEVSYSHLTSPRYYTPEVHPPTPTGNFFEDLMHETMRYDILPPPTPRRHTTTKHRSPPATSD
eukprot:66878-Pyramimonas_sp.AAC.1